MKITLKQARTVIIGMALLILAGGVGYWFGQRNFEITFAGYKPKITIERGVPAGKEDINFSLFWEVWDALERSYLDKKVLDPGKMVYGAISGMVSSLGDPYTVFLPPTENKLSKEDLSGAFEGVGIELGYKNSHLAVIAPLSGTPAEAVGVKAGDLILNIKDEKKGIDKDTTGMSLLEAVALIRGPEGTPVILTLSREGTKEPFDVSITRGTIVVKSVEVVFKNNIAHLKLLRFGERTYQEWEEAVSSIVNHQPSTTGVILDLRNNPGGFLEGAVFISSEFLESGVVVKQQAGQDGQIETFSVNRKGRLTSIPLIVLVNEGSASASEIVAGALQERGRAEIVGEATFGKGTIQEAKDFSGGAGLHVTIAQWLLPSGKSIDKEGVKPDYEVAMDEEDQTKDPQLDKAIELLTS